MENSELKSLLHFEGEALSSVNILSCEEVEPNALFIVADLQYNTGEILRVPFVYYSDENILFTPWDWQAPELPENANKEGIENIKWRVEDTADEGIILHGLPRLL